MILSLTHNHQKYIVNLSNPLDISIPIKGVSNHVSAWYVDPPKIEPVTDGNWVGKVSEGASVNFNTITFNPHGHGTHTECVGHITPSFHSINRALEHYFYVSEVISILPQKQEDDHLITKEHIKNAMTTLAPEALIIRTIPNKENKQNKQYSNTNWPYLTQEAAVYIRELGIKHLLIDLPSIDKEKDQGKLLAHKAFWNYPKATRHEATITEMIYVNNMITDGLYVLNLQIAPFENDATPSKPILYKMLEN